MHRGFWIACIVLSTSSRVLAAELHWDVPDGCPDVHALEQETERVLGGSLAQYALQVNAIVTRAPAQLNLSLRITLPNSAETRERQLQAASCQELLEAAAVAIALAAADSGEASAQAVAQSTDSELLNPRPPPSAAAAPAIQPNSQLALSAMGATNLGVLPHLGLGLDVQVAWIHDWLRIALGAGWFPLRSMQLSDGSRASFGMYFAELLLCIQEPLGHAHVFGCASASLGRIAAHLDEATPGLTESTAWRAMGAVLGASYPIFPPLELTASLAAWAPFTRPRFYITPMERTVHQPTAVVPQLLLGLLFSL